jgi:hypothetical protein
VRSGREFVLSATEYGRMLRDERFIKKGSRISEILKPGDSFTAVATITKLFEIERPGKYVVEVTRTIPDTLGRGTVKSNPITISVGE